MTQEEIDKLQIGDVIFDMSKKEAYHLVKIEDGCVYYEGTPHWGSIPKANLLKWNMVSLMRDRVVYCKDTVGVMTSEKEKLLLIDLAARVPYGVMVEQTLYSSDLADKEQRLKSVQANNCVKLYWNKYNIDDFVPIHYIKPYLRSMSTMTTEETLEFVKTTIKTPDGYPMWTTNSYDWLNKYHFDYRGLIPMRLALEAPEDMYKTK